MDEKMKENTKAEEVQELDDDALDEVSGGTMRGNIVTNKTTSISDDTKRNI